MTEKIVIDKIDKIDVMDYCRSGEYSRLVNKMDWELGIDVNPYWLWKKTSEELQEIIDKGIFSEKQLKQNWDKHWWKFELLYHFRQMGDYGINPTGEQVNFYELDCENEYVMNGNKDVPFILLKWKPNLKNTNKNIKGFVSRKVLGIIRKRLPNYTQMWNNELRIFSPLYDKDGDFWGNPK